jgi:hypothetical protein
MEKKICFYDATQKSATLVVGGIVMKLQPTWQIFEKCSHIREKGGVMTEIWHIRNRLSRTVVCTHTCSWAGVTDCTRRFY